MALLKERQLFRHLYQWDHAHLFTVGVGIFGLLLCMSVDSSTAATTPTTPTTATTTKRPPTTSASAPTTKRQNDTHLDLILFEGNMDEELYYNFTSPNDTATTADDQYCAYEKDCPWWKTLAHYFGPTIIIATIVVISALMVGIACATFRNIHKLSF